MRDIPGRQETNDDEAAYGDFRGSFSKTLEHNHLGEVKPASYRSLLRALRRNRQADYEAIRLDQTVRTRKLANPQGAYKIMMSGLDGQATRMRPAPAFASGETAAEMGEVYAKALLRDVPFTDFESNTSVAWAVNALNALSETVGPKESGLVTPTTAFRGETPGDLVGPYISQFLLRDIPYGPGVIEQRYAVPTAGLDFMTDYDEWLAVQRGGVLGSLFKADPRYIYNGRSLGEYVHVDVLFQAYFNAGLILLGLGAGLDTNNPYTTSKTQGGFVTFGGPDILDLLTKAATLSLTGAWYQKWLVHRRLRPEAYGGRLHNQIVGAKNYGLPAEIEGSDLVHEAFSRHGGYLLPMAYAEGSPTHPAYPAGHATVAGACATVLKAVFEEDFVLTENVQANANGTALIPYYDELTVGGEINKLANNVALGRDWAGVHYRSDGVDGLLVGEQQAIGMLQDFSRTYNEDFDGFQLTTFEGRPIRIKDGGVR
ncbi:MAG: vanadium-dependent haloperoxidase [Pseudomonadota bacterium]